MVWRNESERGKITAFSDSGFLLCDRRWWRSTAKSYRNGNEAGAWPGYWTPGGYTKPGGVMEAVIEPVPKTEYIVTENILGK